MTGIGDAVDEDSDSGEIGLSVCVDRLVDGWRSSGASSSAEEGEEGGAGGSTYGSVRFRVVARRIISSREGSTSVGRHVGCLAVGDGACGEGGGGWVDARLRSGVDNGGAIDGLRLGCGRERAGLRTGRPRPNPGSESESEELGDDDVASGSWPSSDCVGSGETNGSVRLGCGLINEGLRIDALRSTGAMSTSLGLPLPKTSGDLPLMGVDFLGDGVETLLIARCVGWITGAGMRVSSRWFPRSLAMLSSSSISCVRASESCVNCLRVCRSQGSS